MYHTFFSFIINHGRFHRHSAPVTLTQVFLQQKEAYHEIVQPLEPYVAVFAVFAIPAIVLATDYCSQRSSDGYMCQCPCEMALSLRSLATSAVYFSNPENRKKLLDCELLWRRFAQRLRGRSGTRVPGVGGIRNDADAAAVHSKSTVYHGIWSTDNAKRHRNHQ